MKTNQWENINKKKITKIPIGITKYQRKRQKRNVITLKKRVEDK